jgi:hypothetical protein
MRNYDWLDNNSDTLCPNESPEKEIGETISPCRYLGAPCQLKEDSEGKELQPLNNLKKMFLGSCL